VAGGDGLGAEIEGVVEKRPELDLAVAEDVRVGRAPGGVLGEEMLEYAVPVLGGELDPVQGDPEVRAGGLGGGEVLVGGAVAGVVRVVPVLHEQALDLPAGGLQLERGDGGIHTP
jgi:hypothetical protein